MRVNFAPGQINNAGKKEAAGSFIFKIVLPVPLFNGIVQLNNGFLQPVFLCMLLKVNFLCTYL
jgi:hypothetical protein